MGKKGETKLQKEKRKKKEMNVDIDYAKTIEKLPGDQAKKYIIDKIEEERAVEDSKIDTVKTYLQGKGAFSYRKTLADQLVEKLHRLDFPLDWEYDAIPTDGTDIQVYGRRMPTRIGIVVIVKKGNGDVLMRKVLTTGDPEIDMKNMSTMSTQVENTIDSHKGLLLSDNVDTASTLKKTEGGIYLPNENKKRK